MSLHSESRRSSDTPATPRWWYGVACFPLVPLLSMLSTFSVVLLGGGSYLDAGGSPPDTLVISWLLLTFAAQLFAVFVALGVFTMLAADLWALRRGDYGWQPSWAWALGGVVNVVAALLYPLYVISLPTLGYYLYRRHQRLGAP